MRREEKRREVLQRMWKQTKTKRWELDLLGEGRKNTRGNQQEDPLTYI